MKLWFSAKELAGIAGLSIHPSNINRLAKRENWVSQPKKGVKGGGLEYAFSSLPAEVQIELQKQFAVVEKPKLPVVKKQIDLENITTKQREIADARMALVAYVQNLEQVKSRDAAIKFICSAAKNNQLPDELMALVERANCKNGKNCGRVLSHRTLYGWILDYNKAKTPEERLKALVPSQRKADRVEDISWLPDYLAVYRNTNGVSIAEAYVEFAHKWQHRRNLRSVRGIKKYTGSHCYRFITTTGWHLM